MKKTILFLFLFQVSAIAFSQVGVWTWMKGSNLSNQAGNYGVKGVASPTNIPSNRYQAAYWRDLQGNFWIFGGSAKVGLNVESYNDMWRYSVATNQWTWISGPQTTADPNGEFGTQGIPSVNNYPSARGNGSICWVDNTGMFWLFAGDGVDAQNNSGILSDLWKFNPTTFEWTWVKGSNLINQPAVYGSIGIPNIANTPGARNETQSGWVDNSNDLWMSGGNNSTTAFFNNDMWRYHIATNEWTWMKGPNVPNNVGNYGTMGIETATNMPPARWSYTKWKGSDGSLYSFAGKTILGSSNDLWRYSPTTNNWTWISGSNTANDVGNYNIHCSPSATNYPPSRYENQTSQTIGCSDVFWTFGGRSFTFNNFNDLWIYNTLTDEWTWASGNSTPNSAGNFGTQGIASATNMISARFGVCMWTDTANNVWVFGGQDGLNYMNDMWRYQPDTTCFSAPLVASFTLLPPIDTVICYGDTADVFIPATATVSWTPSTGVYPNADTSILHFVTNSNTTYTLTGVDAGICPGIDTLVFSLTINSTNNPVLIPPVDTVICQGEITSMTLDPALTVNLLPTQGASTNADTSMLSFSPNTTTTYTLIGKYDICSQPDTIQFTIVVIPKDIVNLNPPSPLSICVGQNTTMSLDPSYSISYSPSNFVTPNSDTSVLTFNPLSSTNYTVTAVSNGPCPTTIILPFTITVTPISTVNIPPIANTTICAGSIYQVNVNNAWHIVVNPMNGVSFNSDTSKISFAPNTITTYTIYADAGICSIPDSASFTIDVQQSPVAAFDLSPTIAPLKDAIFSLTNQSTNALTYDWLLNGIYFSNQVNTSRKINQVGEFCFSLIAKNANGCTDTATNCGSVTEDPSYVFFPNAFTPNGDGKNDEFKPVSNNIVFKAFIIYDRWGTEVFNNNTGLWGWDGKLKGVELPSAVYYYYFKYSIKGKEEIKKGDVTLLR